ncbi:MAG: T9SS type A sorting domain-containing protein, partial [Haliscomenobacter sp.]
VSYNSLITYSPALTLRKFPLRYGDQGTYRSTMTITCAASDASPLILRKLPFQPDSLRFRVNVERLTEVDAWGRLIIPGGIYDVLRERQTESWDIQIDVRVGRRKWQHISSMLDIPIIFPHTETLGYAFYSNSFPEPIAKATMEPGSGNTVAHMAFKVFDTEETPLLTSLSPNIFFYPNPAIVNARFEFFNLPTGEYELSIFDPIGRPILLKRYSVSGNRTEKIDVSEFRKGGYLYTLKDSRGNTIATKRFTVIRP